jgi:ribosomal protein S18 acetylase RimI-like enzyme
MKKIEVVPANMATDIPALAALDKQCYYDSDLFDEEDWQFYKDVFQFFRIKVDSELVCSLVLGHNMGAWTNGEEIPPTSEGSLYLAGLAIPKDFRGQGIGFAAMLWVVDYARQNGFRKVVSICRKSNEGIVALSKKFGFSVVEEIPEFSEDPEEPCLVLEFLL